MYLVDFIKNNSNWEELLSHSPFNIKISRDDGYILFKYNQIESDFSLPEVRESRGIILRESDYKVVCHPFDKFGNYGESYCPDIDWSTASVQEKIDGSLMKVWFDETWHISTNGTINAFKSQIQSIKYNSFGELFMSALPINFDELTSLLNKDYTYMFELISPFNRVVINYDTTELYFLGVRNINTQQESMPEYTELFNTKLFKIPKRYNLHTLQDVQKSASILPWDEEGYVVCDGNFNRVKIKSPEYVKAHYTRNNSVISYERLIDIIRSGEKSEFLIYASDFKDDLERVEKVYNEMISTIRFTKEKIKLEDFETRKDFALEVLKQPKWLQVFLFDNKSTDDSINNVSSKRWEEYMRLGGFIE